MSTLLRKALVIDQHSPYHQQTVDILIADGEILEIATEISNSEATVIEANGLCISPGWIDTFADYREPGYEQKETIATGLAAANAGGFAGVMVVPNTMPIADKQSGVQTMLQKAKGHATHLYPLGAVSNNAEGKQIAEMLDMRANGALAFSDGWSPVQNSGLLLKALEYVKAFKGIIIQIPVDTNLSTGGLMHEGISSTKLGMPGIPTISETLMVYKCIELVRYTGSRMHLTGISAAESVALIRNAKAEGLDITCATTPYHLVLNDDALISYNSVYKVLPPIRTEADRQALIAGIEDGTIDCIASHHRPQDWDAKAKEFEYAGDGMNVQEYVFPIVWNALSEQINLATIINALGNNPASIFGINQVIIDKNAKGKFTIFSTEASTLVDKDKQKSKGINNPFFGQTLKGKVISVI